MSKERTFSLLRMILVGLFLALPASIVFGVVGCGALEAIVNPGGDDEDDLDDLDDEIEDDIEDAFDDE
jgi:hypothetical protein